MTRTINLALLIVVLTVSAVVGSAATIGPYDDLQTIIQGSSSTQFRSTGKSHNGWNLKDQTAFTSDLGAPDVAIRAAAYATSATGDFQAGSVIITTIYGLDVVSGGSALNIGGFSSGTPEIGSIFGEQIIGLSGSRYSANVALTPSLSELPGLLPGFDLTPFQGSPSSFFYLFQTTAPGADLQLVPEPSSLVMLCLGAIGLSLYRRE